MMVLAGETRDAVAAAAHAAGRKLSYGDFETGTGALALLGQAYSAGDFAAALNSLHVASRRIAGFFEQYDVLLTPTLAQPPVPTGSLQPTAMERREIALVGRLNAAWLLKALRVVGPLADKTFDFMPYTAVFNVTGQPAMSVPLHWNAHGPAHRHAVRRDGTATRPRCSVSPGSSSGRGRGSTACRRRSPADEEQGGPGDCRTASPGKEVRR